MAGCNLKKLTNRGKFGIILGTINSSVYRECTPFASADDRKEYHLEKVYELTVLFHPDLEMDLEKPLKKVEGIITDNSGKIVKQDNWGKRRLAYVIKKQEFAVYVLMEVAIAPANANKVQGLLNITDEVLRYLMVEKDLKAPEASEKPAEDAEEAKSEEE